MKKGGSNSEKGKTAPPPVKRPRQIAYTSQRCFRIAQLGWEWVLASLPIDIILVLSLADKPSELPPDGMAIALILVIVAAAGTMREQIFTLISRLRLFQMKIEQRHLKYLLLVLGALGGAEIVARVLARPAGPPLAFIAVGIVIVVVSVTRSFKQIKKHGERFLSDKLAQVEQANTLHLAAIGIPLAAARLASLSIALQSWDLTTTACGSLGALVLILALHPTQRDFMAPCKKCQLLTSRVLAAEGYCPNCTPEKFTL